MSRHRRATRLRRIQRARRSLRHARRLAIAWMAADAERTAGYRAREMAGVAARARALVYAIVIPSPFSATQAAEALQATVDLSSSAFLVLTDPRMSVVTLACPDEPSAVWPALGRWLVGEGPLPDLDPS